MLQVDFHFNAPDKWPYVCRLLRKISSQGKRTGVCGPEDALHLLHQSLWNLNPSDFVTHCWQTDSDIMVTQSSIILSTDWLALRDSANLQVGLNLNTVPPPDLGAINRLVEVVGPDESDKISARTRWKHYTQLGFTINRYDLSAQTV
jgi:DNA polymerase III subunit chi